MLSSGRPILMRAPFSRCLSIVAFGGFATVPSATAFQNVPILSRYSKTNQIYHRHSLVRHESTGVDVVHDNSQGTTKSEAYRFRPVDNNNTTTLVVGDGDLSYCASISAQIATSGGALVASVLENEQDHERVYQNSRQNAGTISSYPAHRVLFETDATQLHKTFPAGCFDRIVFNFPHWRGKANNRYNRQLMGDFLESASQVLKNNGEIHVALKIEQGGQRARDVIAWKLSWKAAELAAEAGLLLIRLDPFEDDYDVSSYRGADKSFHVGANPDKYVFAFPNGDIQVERHLQLCYRHELRIVLDDEVLEKSPHSASALLDSDIILDIARDIAYDGVHVDVPMRARINPKPGKNTDHFPLLVYLLVYGGERTPLTRKNADKIRERLEDAVEARLGFEVAKRGRLVSNAFPYRALEQLMQDYSC